LHAFFYRLLFFFFRTKRCLASENLPFEEKAILPDIYGNFDFKFCLGTRNFSRVDLRFCFWIVSFQFSLNIVNSSLISYSNDNGNYVEEYAFEAKPSMANNNV